MESEIPKVAAEGAYSDLSDLVNKSLTLKTGLAKGQWVTTHDRRAVGSKPAPLDELRRRPSRSRTTPTGEAGPKRRRRT